MRASNDSTKIYYTCSECGAVVTSGEAELHDWQCEENDAIEKRIAELKAQQEEV